MIDPANARGDSHRHYLDRFAERLVRESPTGRHLLQSDADPNALGAAIDRVVRKCFISYRNRKQPLPNRRLMYLTYKRLFLLEPLEQDELLRLAEAVAASVRVAVLRRATKRLHKQNKQHSSPSTGPETDLALADSAPSVVLGREKALGRIEALENEDRDCPKRAQVYRLHTFAGLSSGELAELLGLPLRDVECTLSETFAAIETARPADAAPPNTALPAEIDQPKADVKAPDELGLREPIKAALGSVLRSHWRSDDQTTLPDNTTLVDDLCLHLGWFDALDADAKRRVYGIAGEEIESVRAMRLGETATTHPDQSTRLSAARLAERQARERECLARLIDDDPRLAEIYSLAVLAGRSTKEIASLIGKNEAEAERTLQVAHIEMKLFRQGAS